LSMALAPVAAMAPPTSTASPTNALRKVFMGAPPVVFVFWG
jgi:hypothetical protein